MGLYSGVGGKEGGRFPGWLGRRGGGGRSNFSTLYDLARNLEGNSLKYMRSLLLNIAPHPPSLRELCFPVKHCMY